MPNYKIKSRYACDFETSNKDGTVRMASFIRYENNGKFIELTPSDIDKVHITYNIEKMLDWILDENGESGRIELWFTNSTKFDTHAILRGFLTKNNFKQTIEDQVNENEFALLEPTKIGAMTVRFKYLNTLFSVRDIKLYISLSVAEKGRMVGVEKGGFKDTNLEWLSKDGEIDWNIFDWDKLDKLGWEAITFYSKKDALIDALYNTKHFSLLGFPKKLTKSGEAFITAENWVKEQNKNNFEQMYLTIENNKDIWTKHIQGGLNYTNPNEIMIIHEDCLELDKTSMYPDNMRFPLPTDGGRKTGTPEDLKLFKIRIKSIKMKKEYYHKVGQGILPTNYIDINDGFDFEYTTQNYAKAAKNIIVEKWEEEWNWYKIIHDIDFEIIDIKYFKKATHLKPLMEKLFFERDAEKKLVITDPKNATTHDVIQNDIKIKMNSIFGVLLENPIKQQYFYSKDEISIGEQIHDAKHKNCITIMGKSNIKTNGYFRYITQTTHDKKFRKNLYIGSYITMKGRIFMYPHMLTGKLLRIDTDGYTAKKDWIVPEGFVRDGLGGMKIEYKKMKKYFMVVGSKAYFYSDTKEYFENKTSMTFKGIHKLNIENGTKLDEINWTTITGTVKNRKLVNSGPIIENKIKYLRRQAMYYERKKRK